MTPIWRFVSKESPLCQAPPRFIQGIASRRRELRLIIHHRSPQRHERRRRRRSMMGIVLYSALLTQDLDREVSMRCLTRERHSKFGVNGYEVLRVSNHFLGGRCHDALKYLPCQHCLEVEARPPRGSSRAFHFGYRRLHGDILIQNLHIYMFYLRTSSLYADRFQTTRFRRKARTRSL
jgi:hypothetical protein